MCLGISFRSASFTNHIFYIFKGKPYALILDGNDHKSTYLEDVLRDIAGQQIFQVKWTSTADVLVNILKGIADECSLLIISIMSHGKRGDLNGAMDNLTLLQHRLKNFPQHIPLVK